MIMLVMMMMISPAGLKLQTSRFCLDGVDDDGEEGVKKRRRKSRRKIRRKMRRRMRKSRMLMIMIKMMMMMWRMKKMKMMIRPAGLNMQTIRFFQPAPNKIGKI